MVRELKAGGGGGGIWDGQNFEGLGSVVWVLWVAFLSSSFILAVILSCGSGATRDKASSATQTDAHGAACGAGCSAACGG